MKMKQRIGPRVLVIIASCFLSWSAYCQAHYQFKQFSLREGLEQSQVLAIEEDKYGHLFVGLQGGGVNYFNGITFTKPAFAHSESDRFFMRMHQVKELDKLLAISQSGNFYTVSPDSLIKIDLQLPESVSKKGSFIKYPAVWQGRLYSISSNGDLFILQKTYKWKFLATLPLAEKAYVSCFTTSAEKLYIGTTTGNLYSYSRAGFKLEVSLPEKNTIRDVATSDNSLLIGTNRGLYQKNADNTIQLSKLEVRRLLYHKEKNTIWLAGPHGLFAGNLNTEPTFKKALDIETHTLYMDKQGIIWAGTMGAGLFQITSNFVHYNHKQGLSHPVIMALGKDKLNRIWAGTQNNGFQLIGTDGKLSKTYLPQTEHPAQNPMANTISVMHPDRNGGMWLGTSAGLVHYNSTLEHTQWLTSNTLKNTRAMACASDNRNNLWVGYSEGITVIKPDGTEESIVLHDSIKYFTTWALHYDSLTNYVYAGTNKGTYQIHAANKKVNFIGPEVGLSIANSKGFIVVGSETGLAVYNSALEPLASLDQTSGIPSGFVYSVTKDEKENLWLGTAHGLVKVILNQSGKIEETLTYTDKHGFDALESNHGANLFDGQQLWIGTIDGVYAFNPNELPKPSLSPQIIQVSTQGKNPEAVLPASLLNNSNSSPVLHYKQNQIRFKFSVADRYFADQIEYKYKLEGRDKQFSAPTKETSTSFAGLAPGSYSFILRAGLPTGQYKEISYPFTIEAPFYQKPLFIIFSSVLGLALLFTGIRYRTHYKLEQANQKHLLREQTLNEIRKEIARDFHDEMGNRLVRIINYANMLKISPAENNTELIEKVESSARQLYGGTRDFIWSLNPENDSLAEVAAYIADFGARLFEEKKISFYTQMDLGNAITLPAGHSREIVLILKEAMTNIFKHAGASKVHLKVNQDKGNICWQLADNGVGIAEPENHYGRGLENMRTRAKKLKGKLILEDNSPTGTSISLTIPLNAHAI